MPQVKTKSFGDNVPIHVNQIPDKDGKLELGQIINGEFKAARFDQDEVIALIGNLFSIMKGSNRDG